MLYQKRKICYNGHVKYMTSSWKTICQLIGPYCLSLVLYMNLNMHLNMYMNLNAKMKGCKLQNSSYIGQTRNTIQKWLEQPGNNGLFKEHITNTHGHRPTLAELSDNTRIIKQLGNPKRLFIYVWSTRNFISG